MTSIITSWAPRAAVFLFPGLVGRLPASGKTVYLTFDDGPSSQTVELLDVLRQHHARATFFLRGDRVEGRPAEVQRIAAEGHGIGNHSYRHLDAWTHGWTEIRRDLEEGDRAVQSAAGSAPVWVRPPYGRVRPSTGIWCRLRGKRLALWDVMAGDFYRHVDEAEVVRRAAASIRRGSILVLHDGDEQQPRALAITRQLLDVLGGSGWTFEKLPEGD